MGISVCRDMLVPPTHAVGPSCPLYRWRLCGARKIYLLTEELTSSSSSTSSFAPATTPRAHVVTHHMRNRSRLYGARFTDGCFPSTISAITCPVMPPSVQPT